MKQYTKHLLVCEMGGSCSSKGYAGMREALKEIISSRGLADKVKVTKTGCLGACGFGPNLVIYPDGIWYHRVQQADLTRIIDETVVGGRTIDDLLFHKLGDPSVVEVVKDPVCGMVFRANVAAFTETHQERKFYFCSEECRRAFLADPGAYGSKKHSHQAVPGHSGQH